MTTRLLHIVSPGDDGDACAQVAALTRRLPRDEYLQQVVSLRTCGADDPLFASAGVQAAQVNTRFAWDPFALVGLRSVAKRFRPAIVHAWGSRAAGYAAAGGVAPRLVTSGSVAALPRRLRRNTHPNLNAPPAAFPAQCATRSREELGLPPDVRLIGVASRLLPKNKVQDLIWAIDLIRVMRKDVWLVIVGKGPQRAALERFSSLACEENRTMWLDDLSALDTILPVFDVFWTAETRTHPPQSVMQAMAAGIPVVADRSPGLELAVEEKKTGFLVPCGDRAARGKATLKLLEDDNLRERLGQNSQQRVAERFAIEPWLAAHRAAYAGR